MTKDGSSSINLRIINLSKKHVVSAKDLLLREDGRIEWICSHGVGHTIYNPNDWGEYAYVHGCDGCCSFVKI